MSARQERRGDLNWLRDRCSKRALHGIVTDLAPRYAVVALAIRKPPFSGLPETVAAVWQSYRLQCAADGMLYRLAICRAARQLKLHVHLCRHGEETSGQRSNSACHLARSRRS
jgi:hypothetical protein